jgi:hypothetical protein
MIERDPVAEAELASLVNAHGTLQAMVTLDPTRTDARQAVVALERVLDRQDPTWAERSQDIVLDNLRQTMGEERYAAMQDHMRSWLEQGRVPA